VASSTTVSQLARRPFWSVAFSTASTCQTSWSRVARGVGSIRGFLGCFGGETWAARKAAWRVRAAGRSSTARPSSRASSMRTTWAPQLGWAFFKAQALDTISAVAVGRPQFW
jgi:hypothetical protein